MHSRDKGKMRVNVGKEVDWQLGNYSIGLKCHDEKLTTHSINRLTNIPMEARILGLISNLEKEKLEKYINDEKLRIEGEFKNGRM